MPLLLIKGLPPLRPELPGIPRREQEDDKFSFLVRALQEQSEVHHRELLGSLDQLKLSMPGTSHAGGG